MARKLFNNPEIGMPGAGDLGDAKRGEGELSPRRWIALIAIASTVGLLGWLSTEPFIEINEQGGDEILLRLPPPSSQASARVRQLKTRVQETPDDIVSVAELTRLYIERSRRESDPRYLGYAQHLLKPWWRQDAPPPTIRRLRAVLLQAQHRFNPAIADLDALLLRDPNDAQSLLTRATVHQVMGNYHKAMADCLRLLQYAPIHAIACSSSILSLTGRASDAQALMTQIELQLRDQTVETRQWILTLRGEIAEREHRIEQAEHYYQQALDEPQRNAYLLRVYSRFLLHRGQADTVLSLLRDEIHDDSLLLLAALAAQQIKDAEQLQNYSALIETRLRNARLRGANDHYYMSARYALEIENLPAKALPLARANWLQSKEVRDTELFVAAAIASADQSALAEIEQWMSSQNTVLTRVESLLKFHRDKVL